MGGMAMNCMKCGREIKAGQVFCGECLALMEKYPVKPGTVVQLPPKTETEPVKKQPRHRRTAASPEEQVKRLTKRVRRLTLAVILTTALAVFFALLSFDILEKAGMQKLPGQNYSTVIHTTPEETTAPAGPR